MTIHVTETQKFIARAALEVSGADERLLNHQLIDDMIRAMLVIERAGMQAYMLQGFNHSCRARYHREPTKVSQDHKELKVAVNWFADYIDQGLGEAARRIRGNRARSLKNLTDKGAFFQEVAAIKLQELKMRRHGGGDLNAANWDQEPIRLPVGRPDEDAA